eukprot:1548496-Amphidinium_carterae.1
MRVKSTATLVLPCCHGFTRRGGASKGGEGEVGRGLQQQPVKAYGGFGNPAVWRRSSSDFWVYAPSEGLSAPHPRTVWRMLSGRDMLVPAGQSHASHQVKMQQRHKTWTA